MQVRAICVIYGARVVRTGPSEDTGRLGRQPRGRSARSTLSSLARRSRALIRRNATSTTPADGPPAPDATEATNEFLDRVYRELLDREPDDDGRAYYQDRLRAGATHVD